MGKSSKPPVNILRASRMIREAISRMLNKGVGVPAILERLGDQAGRISEADIAAWQQTGHQDWINERERLAELDRLRELAKQVTGSSEGAAIQEVGLQIAAGHIYELLAWFNPKAFKKKVQGNLADYARVVNMLVRLSDGGLRYERYRAEVAERKTTIQKQLVTDREGRGLTPEAREIIERELKLL